MPAHVPSLNSEAELLAAYINQQLDGVRCAIFGLTEAQANATPSASSLSVAALLNHTTLATQGWLDRVEAAPDEPANRHASIAEAAATHEAEWHPQTDINGLVAAVEQLKLRVSEVCQRVDLTERVPVPSDAPWWPQDVESWQVRWVLLHLVEEIARHAGHADIIRESIDGATMYELKGAVEGWPTSAWFQPWTPSQERSLAE